MSDWVRRRFLEVRLLWAVFLGVVWWAANLGSVSLFVNGVELLPNIWRSDE